MFLGGSVMKTMNLGEEENLKTMLPPSSATTGILARKVSTEGLPWQTHKTHGLPEKLLSDMRQSGRAWQKNL